MTLGSQSPRPNAGRMHMSSRRRGRFPWGYLLFAAAFIGVVCLAFYLIDWTGDPTAEGDEAPTSPRSEVVDVKNNEDRRASVDTRGASVSTPATHDEGTRSNTSPTNPTNPDPAATPPTPRDEEEAAAVREARLPPAEAYARETGDEVARQLAEGIAMIDAGETVEARRRLSGLLFDHADRLSARDAAMIRDRLNTINADLIYSDRIAPGDPLAESHEVKEGEILIRIAPRYHVPYAFIERINNIPASRLRAGQDIKVIRGPFHARVSKRDFRLDVYLEEPDGGPIYVTSFPVGLGENDSTPLGLWKAEAGKKVVNPNWSNPRGGEYFAADDPKNPLGEFWIGLTGIDERTWDKQSYGIHGTIEPDSIGKQSSMGCIRLGDGDIEALYSMLQDGQSLVEVVE